MRRGPRRVKKRPMTGLPDDLPRRILEGSPDAVLVSDRAGAIRGWNAAAERLFGFAAAEALGASMDLIIPERLRGRHWANWDQVMQTGETRYATDVLAVPALRKDGRALSIEFTIALLRDASGAVKGPAAILRDVTARFERDKALRLRVKELEAELAKGRGGAAVR